MSNEFEKEMLKGTKNVEELLQEEKQEIEHRHELTQEDIDRRVRKDYITKVKVVALDGLGYHPIANPSLMTKEDKKKIILMMQDVMTRPEDEINQLFNHIVNTKLLAPKNDYSNYPVYNI